LCSSGNASVLPDKMLVFTVCIIIIVIIIIIMLRLIIIIVIIIDVFRTCCQGVLANDAGQWGWPVVVASTVGQWSN
jgi:hypothetical protein